MSAKIAAEEIQLDPDEVDMAKKYGPRKEFDPKFKGPIDDRGCTDIICLLLLLAFIGGWIAVAAIAYRQGDPSVLVHPVDSLGQKCGLDSGVEKKPYLYFFDITTCASPNVLLHGCKTPQVCVETCPEYGPWSVGLGDINRESFDTMKKKMICKYSVNLDRYKNVNELKDLVDKKMCAPYILPSKTIARRCIPSTLSSDDLDLIRNRMAIDISSIQKGIEKLIEFINAKENFEFLFEDFKACWHIIVLTLIVGAVASLIWICAMRCIAGIMVWLSLIGMAGVLGFSCYFSVNKYIILRSVNDTDERDNFRIEAKSEVVISEEEFASQLDTYLKLKDTWLVFAIVTGSLLAILLLIILVIRSRLTIAIALIKQGAKAVGDMLSTLFWPLIPWVLQLAVIGFFLTVGIYLISASEKVYKISQNCTCGEKQFIENERCYLKSFNRECSNETSTSDGFFNHCGLLNACSFVSYDKLAYAGWFHLYNFFGLIWALCFISDFGDMVLAGSFAGWYWTFNRKTDLKALPVMSSFLRTLRYHLGTLAFGSLIISIIKFIRFFLEYVDYKLRQYSENPVAKACLCCFKCCFWCLEKFLKFINKNAYIMCSVYGKNFCSSAKDAFFLLMRNALRAFVLDKVTDFLLFMGKLVIIGGVTISSFYIFTARTQVFDDHVPELHFYMMPVIVIAIGTYFITSLFFSVYNMAVDTLFLCFLEDMERHDGSAEKPFYMPKDLMEILGKKNKKEKGE